MKRTLPAATRRAVWERCAETCEGCGYWLPREQLHIHHRKLKSQGGTDDPTNLLALHRDCHTGPRGVHMNPERSYELGHLVRSFEEPADVLVLLHPHMYAQPWTRPAS